MTSKTDKSSGHAPAQALNTRRPGRRWGKFMLIGALLLGAAWLGWRTLGPTTANTAGPSAGGPGGRQSSPVVVREASRGDMPVSLSALGTVTARNTATVRVQVSGRLQQVLFREGQMVKAGQVLARIDARSFQTAVDSAAAQLAKDQATLNAARVDLQRYQTLLTQNSIASQQVDTQTALVNQLQGTVAVDQAALAQAKLQLSYTAVTAPISGRTGLRVVDAGNVVQTSDTGGLVVITEVQPINVTFPLPQQQLQAVLARQRTGDEIQVEAWDAANSQQLASGKLVSIDNQIDTTTGTVKLKAEFPNDDGRLFPNQFVNVRLVVDTLKDVVLVPLAAVQPGSSGSFVFVVDDENKATMRKVTTGASDAQQIAIVEGLRPGARVVTDGVDRVRDGATVQVMAERETPKAPAPSAKRRSKRSKPSGEGDGPPPGGGGGGGGG